MKKQHIILALGAMFMASCADEFDRHFEVGRPELSAEYAYLSDYKALKEYVADPNFKLGIGTDAADYANQGPTYVITNVNFSETVAGNAMKMASCVGDDGNLNFGTVEAYVSEAAKAGLNVFGHTLAWHAQQPVKWLNALIADKPIPVTPGGGNPCLVFDNGEGGANQWDKEGIYTLPTPMIKGKTYIVTASVKTDAAYPDGTFGLWPIWEASPNKNQWGGSNDVQYLTSYATSKTFTDLTWEFVANFDHDKLQFVFGKIAGKVCLDNVSCKEKGSDTEMVVNGTFDKKSTDGWSANWNGPSFAIEGQAAGGAVKYWESVIANGDMEGTDANSFASKSDQGATVYKIFDGVGKDGSRGVKITSKGGYDDAWESQFWIVASEALPEGTKVHVKFDYKADGGCAGTNVDTQAHFNPGEYQHYACAGTVAFTSSWQTYDKQFVVDAKMAGSKGMKSVAFNMSPNTASGAYYIDNVVLEIEKENTGGIPQTDEEKKDTLIYAMDKWIHGMMDACRDDEGNLLVKAWDVVNEPIGANGELQHGTPDNKNDFFWQDYLGDLDYVRTAVKLARQYGGNDLKLFVNDYNLEYDWDASGNKKLESLISWINKWESDGVTKIDGIGTQMHLSCYADATEAQKRKDLIVNSFKLMAQTGKLVRISELDMGYVDAENNVVKTVDMTEEQHHQMAEFYKWIIQQYKTIIPAAQQWGITLWCATDAPANSGWRPGEPVGIWDQNFYRKHVYAGVADGLSGE